MLVVGLLHILKTILGRSFIKMNFQFWSKLASTANVLSVLDAKVGDNSHICSDICVYNLDNYSCRNLSIGSNVYIGPRCLFDLTSRIIIRDDASISAQVSFITHIDVGSGALKKLIERKEGPITIDRGAWIGVNSTILQGVNIGEYSMVGAMSLVNKTVPPNTIAYGIPCRVKKKIDES